MFRLAWPVVVLQLLQVAYNIADTFWLGQHSTAALAAVSLAFPLIFLLISLGGGFTVAGSTLIAQYTGAKSEGSAGKVAGQTLSFVTILAAILGVLGFFVTDGMLGLLPSQAQTANVVVPLAADYMKLFFLGLPFLFGFYIFEALMRGYGNTRAPMRIMGVSVALNVVIDPILIFGWGGVPALGIEGAALATVLSRGIATVLGLYVLFQTDLGPEVAPSHFLPDPAFIWDIVRIGVPSALEQSMSALALIALTAIVVTFAPPVVAAYGLGNRLVSLVFLPALGLARGTETVVGQNLGAQKPDRAERAVWLAVKAGSAVLLIAAIIAFIFAEPIVAIFAGADQTGTTIEYGVTYLRIRSAEFTFMALMQVLLGAYRGAGNTKTAMAFSILTLWIVRVPLVYYLVFPAGLGPLGIWIGMATGHIIGGILAALWFTRGTWKQAVIDDTPQPTPDND